MQEWLLYYSITTNWNNLQWIGVDSEWKKSISSCIGVCTKLFQVSVVNFKDELSAFLFQKC